jgi:hypothetical protein
MNSSRNVFSISFLLAIFISANVAAQHDEEDRSAAINARNHKKHVVNALHDCALLPPEAGSNYFKFLGYLWASANEFIAMAAEDVLARTSSDAKRSTDNTAPLKTVPALSLAEGLGAPASPQVCETLAKKTRSLQLDFANVYPGDAKRLLAIFSVNAAWKINIRNMDFTVGCVKSYWNRGEKDFVAVKSSCDCQTAVLLKTGSELQISEWVKDIGLLGAEAATAKKSNAWLKSVTAESLATCSR